MTSLLFKSFKNKKAFSLLEAVMALSIMVVILIVVYQGIGGNEARVRKARDKQELAILLERKMLELELQYKGKALSEIPKEDEGDFGQDYPQYTWRMKSKSLKFPDLGKIAKKQSEDMDPNIIQGLTKLSEHYSKSVKEVKLSITVKIKSRKNNKSGTPTTRTVNLVRYFVDFDKAPSL